MTDLKAADAALTPRGTEGVALPGGGRRRSRAVGLILLVVALAFCGWSGWAYWQSTHDESLSVAKTRDQVGKAARRQIADLNTIDARRIDAGLLRWQEVSTGPLRTALRSGMAQSKLRIQQSGRSTRGTVTDLAVTELDARSGSAQVIATVRITTSPVPVGTSGDDRQRFSAVLTRTGDGWKLGSLTAVGVGTN